jgi:hypothetical protein
MRGEKSHHETPQPAMTKFYDVVREAAPGLPGYTVYRPVHPTGDDARDRLPIVTFSNGGCMSSNDYYIKFLMEVAAHGFVVVAYGAPESHSMVGSVCKPERLINAIDWATSRPGHGGPGYFNQLDTSRIAVMGQSCGGWDAVEVGSDRRVKSVVSLNSGFFPVDIVVPGTTEPAPFSGDRAALARLNGPVIFINGGPTDVAYTPSLESYALVNKVPAVLAVHATAGHMGFYDSASQAVQLQLVTAVVDWLDGTLNGNTESLGFLVGTNPGLGLITDWTVEWKNF